MTTSNTDLRPADTWLPIDIGESDYVAFDFAEVLDDAESISTVELSCEVVDGVDATASARLVGDAAVSGSVVRQTVATAVEGVEYLIRCAATTSVGRVLVLAGRLPVLKVGAAIDE